MIITKTPFKMPFAGGLTDLKAFAHRYDGVTVSATIDKHLYVGLKPNVDGYLNLKYMDVHEKVTRVDDVRHPLVREALKLLQVRDKPLDFYIMTDLNSESGLGSSGAVTVGVLHALHAFKNESVTREQLLEEASHIEVDVLEGASGYHDPAICALGGLRLIEYGTAGVKHRAITLSDTFRKHFQHSLLFFYGGTHNKSKPSLDILNNEIERATDTLNKMKNIAYQMERAFKNENLREVGRLLQAQQDFKQLLPGKFENEYVKDVVSRAKRHDAYCQLPGGKIGAFVMVLCADGQQQAIRAEFNSMTEVQFDIEFQGTQLHRL